MYYLSGENMQPILPNPLARHFRQPKIYIRLPSNGEYYHGGIVKTENNEYPILGMTARDELLYKTPDALINGQATVDIIQSCVPNIKNAWNVPNIDLDAILVAIRIATVSEMLDLTVKIPGLNEERTYQADLRMLLDQIYNQHYDNVVVIGDFSIEVQPTSYRYFTDIALRTFEEQKIFKILKNDLISESDKMKQIQGSFKKLTDINIELVKNSIVSIQYQNDQPVTEPGHISEFIENCEKEFFSGIIEHVEKQKEKFSLKPMTIQFSKEDQEKGAPESLSVPIMLDQSNFFGKGS
jgi:hypothetical protein